MIKFYKNNKGQSLIELSVAVGLTSMALIAILSLILISIATQRKSSNYYTAVNLAREAVEAARNIRDTNWLIFEKQKNDNPPPANFVNWDDGLHGPNIYSAILQFDPQNIFSSTQSRFSFNFIEIGQDLENKKTIYKKDIGSSTVYIDSITAQSCSDCLAIDFKRWIYLKPICDGSGPNAILFSNPYCPRENPADPKSNFICENEGVCDPTNAPQIGIRAIAQINWTEGGKPGSLTLISDLYNWR